MLTAETDVGVRGGGGGRFNKAASMPSWDLVD